ncbi:MAG: DNA polymerase III subunit beta, partial [Actinomycetota bacterium]
PELARALRQVVPAASGDEGRPVLTGVLWSLRDGELRLVATDSYRLALRDLAVTAGAAGEAVVPGRALAEFARHLNGDEEASIWVGGTQGGFEVGRTRMVTRLIEGKFPDYRQLIPDAYPHRLVADRDQLAEALERMALVAKANTPVKVHLDAEVRLTATQAGVADASETVDGVAYDGDPMVVGFNPRYLIEGLRSLDDGKAVLELVDPGRPGRLRADGHQEFTYVLMPVRLWT